MKTVCFILCLFFLSCGNINDDIDATIDSTSKNARIEIERDLLSLRQKYDSAFYKSMNLSNSETKNKLIDSRILLFQTIKYLDSVNTDLSKYDNNDLNNTKLIQEKFLDSSLGDSVFNKLKTTFYLAENISLNKVKRDTINQISKNVLSDFNIRNWKNNFFSLNSPSGTILVIYGFEYELFKANIISCR